MQLVPFSLFTSQIPLLLLGVIYFLYLGLSFTGRNSIATAESEKGKSPVKASKEYSEPEKEYFVIRFNGGCEGDDDQYQDNQQAHLTGEQKLTPPPPDFIAVTELPESVFQQSDIPYQVFSRPPPCLA